MKCNIRDVGILLGDDSCAVIYETIEEEERNIFNYTSNEVSLFIRVPQVNLQLAYLNIRHDPCVRSHARLFLLINQVPK